MNMGTFHIQRGARRGAVLAACTALLMATGCSSNNSASTTATTQVGLTSSATTINTGAAVTLTATLNSPVTGGAAPIGVITFYDGSTAIQPITLSGTTVTLVTSSLAPGTHSITAGYAGDQTHAASNSSVVSISVFVPTTLTVSSSPVVAATGSPVTLTATISSGTFPASGTVTFLSGTTVLGTADAVPNKKGGGTATLTTTALPVGTDGVTASFAANGSFLASNSPISTVQIFAGRAPTSLAVTATPGPSVASGTLTTITATLTLISGTTPATGTIQFNDGATVLGTAALGSNNSASITTKQFPTGSNTLTASYPGDVSYNPANSPAFTLTVTPYAGATYTNPLNVSDPATGKVYNCPDPAIIKSQNGSVDTWYVYCTGDTFNNLDLAGGNPKGHLISIFSSQDLVNWTYVHDALTALPTWVQAGQELREPAIKFFNGLYHLYYEADVSAAAPQYSGIGVATATTPAGPFTDSGAPVIPQSHACGGGCPRQTFNPEVIADANGQWWIVYGGPVGGILIRPLSADGLTSTSVGEVSIAADNSYQDPFIWSHGGYFYEFVSLGNAFSGPISTLNVHVGRSANITGPYLDAEGNDLNAFSNPATLGSIGGDPALVFNGNDIVGAGSNSLFTDESGQDYILYSGISKKTPYLPNFGLYNARQLMMDPIDWVNGWPKTRNGAGPSDFTLPQPVPAAQPGATNGYVTPIITPDTAGTAIAASSDDFNTATLSTQWTFLHATPSYSLTGSAYSVQTVNADSGNASMSNLPILSEPEPAGNYLIEAKLAFTPPPGFLPNIFANPQAGLFVYSSDINYLRLDEFVAFETRQIEFVNEDIPPANSNYPSIGYAPSGTPNFAGNTWLRIAKRAGSGGAPDTYTSYTSVDGITFLQGPTWTASYGSGAKIGLFAGNTAGYTASFDYIHVTKLLP